MLLVAAVVGDDEDVAAGSYLVDGIDGLGDDGLADGELVLVAESLGGCRALDPDGGALDFFDGTDGTLDGVDDFVEEFNSALCDWVSLEAQCEGRSELGSAADVLT